MITDAPHKPLAAFNLTDLLYHSSWGFESFSLSHARDKTEKHLHSLLKIYYLSYSIY